MRRNMAWAAALLTMVVGCSGEQPRQEAPVQSGTWIQTPGDSMAAALRVGAGVESAQASVLGLPYLARIVLGAATAATTPAEEARSAGTIAGHLLNATDDYTFTSDGGEMIFAVLDSTVFQMAGRGKGHSEGGEAAIVAAGGTGAASDCGKGGCPSKRPALVGSMPTKETEGGCSGETGGGPPGMCMQILDRSGQVVCWADRAMAPGWMRDPKLACPLELAGGYTLRIFKRGTGGNPCGPGANYLKPEAAGRPYLLTVAKKKISSPGSLSAALEAGSGSH
ncbi:MAG TPA: hypothetical protein VFM53_14675 [Anaeromyxobacteraceae bacterium]|nr:hypothetical protein [Anaeromyxobacteraceae bacterium]